jgi:light-regulated signal transduction histidine kinase (bacteriophytochrome)
MLELASSSSNPLRFSPGQVESAEDKILLLKEENKRLQLMLEAASEGSRKDQKRLEALNYFNSHKVRATVAHIWGLANVMHHSKSQEETKDLTSHLQREANELNKLIYEVNDYINGLRIQMNVQIIVSEPSTDL